MIQVMTFGTRSCVSYIKRYLILTVWEKFFVREYGLWQIAVS